MPACLGFVNCLLRCGVVWYWCGIGVVHSACLSRLTGEMALCHHWPRHDTTATCRRTGLVAYPRGRHQLGISRGCPINTCCRRVGSSALSASLPATLPATLHIYSHTFASSRASAPTQTTTHTQTQKRKRQGEREGGLHWALFHSCTLLGSKMSFTFRLVVLHSHLRSWLSASGVFAKRIVLWLSMNPSSSIVGAAYIFLRASALFEHSRLPRFAHSA